MVVTDIPMPPNFTGEEIRATRLIHKQYPGTGVVILSQYDEPEYTISLLSEGAAGYAYLLKDGVAEGDQLARTVREVSAGGSMLKPGRPRFTWGSGSRQGMWPQRCSARMSGSSTRLSVTR
jgi:adenylate cyclase